MAQEGLQLTLDILCLWGDLSHGGVCGTLVSSARLLPLEDVNSISLHLYPLGLLAGLRRIDAHEVPNGLDCISYYFEGPKKGCWNTEEP